MRTRRIRRTLMGVLALVVASVAGFGVAAAIESEGELFLRETYVGNIGVAHADVGVYPDRSATDPVPERNEAVTTIAVPRGATVVDVVAFWAGRGPGWSDPSIVVNGVTVEADATYEWSWPGWDQSTYVADLDEAGISLVDGANVLSFEGLDHGTGRFYGAGVVAIYEHPDLPATELSLFEGNEFAFFGTRFADDIGEAATHSSVHCVEFTPSIDDRPVSAFTRIMGVDSGRGDGPPRSQRLQWWTSENEIETPIVDGAVVVPGEAPAGSIDNPIPPKVAATDEWGSYTVTIDDATLPAGDRFLCTQLQSVDIDDGVGASLSITNQGGQTDVVHRLGNLVWLDENDNGIAEPGEPGIEGVDVELLRDGNVIASTITSADGEYLFEGLVCGTYRVRIGADQGVWRIDGRATDPATLTPGTVVSEDPDDDLDNDNNGVADGVVVISGEVTIGSCADGADEPTDETDRVGGPDDDPEGGPYDDMRSNVSVDFTFVPAPGADIGDGAEECADDGDADNGDANDGDADNTADESCNDTDDQTDDCTTTNGDADNTADESCNDTDDQTDDCTTTNGDANDGDAENTADENCNDTDDCTTNGDADNGADNGDADNTDENCNDTDDCTTTTNGDADNGDADNTDENCNDTDDCTTTTTTNGDADNGDADNTTDEHCGDAEQPGDDTTDEPGEGDVADGSITNDGDAAADDDDDGDITTEVEGQVEERPLAQTGIMSALWILGGLMVIVLGMWFATASAWFRYEN